jgi:hypothetical protein
LRENFRCELIRSGIGIVYDIACMDDEIGNERKFPDLRDERFGAVTGIRSADVERPIRAEMSVADMDDFEHLSGEKGWKIGRFTPV